VALRPLQPGDREALLEGFGRLSPETRYQRFLAPMQRLTERQLGYLIAVDGVNHFAWVAGTLEPDGSELGYGLARFVRLPDDPATAELAVVVADDAQGRGIGTLLVDALLVVAAARGIERLVGYLFAENAPMLRILERRGSRAVPEASGVLRVEIPLPAAVGLDEADRAALLEAAGC
jgi:GNAT superfamily N-acetyltransferase